MPMPPSWPIAHCDGTPYDITLAVNSTMVQSLGNAGQVYTISTDADGVFFAVGSAGINAAPVHSGGLGRPLFSSVYRELKVNVGSDYLGFFCSTSGYAYVEKRL